MRAENEGTAYDDQKGISLIDLFIIILKYKLVIVSFILLSVIAAFLYLNFFKNNSSPVFSTKKVYSSEAWLELTAVIPERSTTAVIAERFPSMDLTMQTSRILFSKYHLPMLHYMVWNDTKGVWGTDKMYIWDDATRKLTIDNQINNSNQIPTLRIKPQNTLFYLTFSCADPQLAPRFLNEFISSTADYYRTMELEKINARIDLYKGLLIKYQDKTLREKASDMLTVNMELGRYIKDNAQHFPYNVLVAPSEASTLNFNELQNVKRNPTKNTLLLVFIGFVALIFILVIVIVYENLHNMKIQDPEKYSLLEKYLRFRG